jgi:hypothetical protein
MVKSLRRPVKTSSVGSQSTLSPFHVIHAPVELTS